MTSPAPPTRPPSARTAGYPAGPAAARPDAPADASSDARKDPRRIGRMFDRIAPTYDLLNRVLSAGVDRAWRREAVAALALRGGERVLDACTGTGDLALAVREAGAGEVVGVDLAPAMVERARAKAGGRARFLVADASSLPFAAASFDAVTVGFGLRNLHDLGAGLREFGRVLRPGGRLLVLEFTRPPNPVLRSLYEAYALVVLPVVGNLVSGGADNAYLYLPRSVRTFPAPEGLASRMRESGFRSVEVRLLSGGIAALHLGER